MNQEDAIRTLSRLATLDTVQAYLDSIGETAYAGTCGFPGKCLIARALNWANPSALHYANLACISAEPAIARRHYHEAAIPTPPQLASLIRRFDASHLAGHEMSKADAAAVLARVRAKPDARWWENA